MHFLQMSEKRINRLLVVFAICTSPVKHLVWPPPPAIEKKDCIKHCFKMSIQYPRKFGNNGLTEFWHENVVYYQMGDVQIANDGNLRSQGGVWTINVPAIMQ